MKRTFYTMKLMTWLLLCLFVASCAGPGRRAEDGGGCNSIYHWKTTFDIETKRERRTNYYYGW